MISLFSGALLSNVPMIIPGNKEPVNSMLFESYPPPACGKPNTSLSMGNPAFEAALRGSMKKLLKNKMIVLESIKDLHCLLNITITSSI